MSRSDELFERAVKVIPGGVNSPVRAYGSVGMTPRFIEGASGPYVVDADSKKYIDYISSWGPMILGHNNQEVLNAVIRKAESGLSFGAATEIEVEMAEFICENIPSIEMIRMVNSGTEAVMSAIRAARGYTGRNKIVKFAGCYHGHSDALLVKAGSGVMTAGIPDSAGVPAGATQDTLTAVYNNLESVKMLFEENEGQIAAVIVEPVAANMGVVLPNDFVDTLRLAKIVFPDWKHRRLGDLANYYGISTVGAHRALTDCKMNQKVFELLGKELSGEGTADVRQNVKTCPKCGMTMVKRKGKFGEFWGCKGFPDCRYTENI